jgi:hypothetical protein
VYASLLFIPDHSGGAPSPLRALGEQDEATRHKVEAMAGHGRPPKHTAREAPCAPWAHALDPYVCFVGAFLWHVVLDAGSETESVQQEAQAFLLDAHRLAPWIVLTGADVDKIQGMLLRAAGLARPPQG